MVECITLLQSGMRLCAHSFDYGMHNLTPVRYEIIMCTVHHLTSVRYEVIMCTLC